MHKSVLAAVAVVFILSSAAWSHEGEHHGGAAPGLAAPVTPAPSQAKPVSTVELNMPQKKGLERTLKQFIQRESEDGVFVVHDEKRDEDWRLKLVKLQLDRVSKLSEKLYSVRGDFKQVGGKKSVAVDFLVNESDEGWSVRQAVIQSK